MNNMLERDHGKDTVITQDQGVNSARFESRCI